jgi:hypothetical protein
MEKIEKEKGKRSMVKKMGFCLVLLGWVVMFMIFPGKTLPAERLTSGGLMTEQEIATEKFFSTLETTIATKFFDYRKRPVIRVAVFDFTDKDGNVVKGGKNLTDEITKRLYPQPQFDIISQEKINRYLGWVKQSTFGKLSAEGILRMQRRLNAMALPTELHALILGEIRKDVSRHLKVSVTVVNFQSPIGEIELEKNIIDAIPIDWDIPLPTEQSLEEAMEVVVPAVSNNLEEGRLIILANTRGNLVVETESISQYTKEQPSLLSAVPQILTLGKGEASNPDEIKVGIGDFALSPLGTGRNSKRWLEYAFLHGKCATNEIYFDEVMPAQDYQFITSFLDSKTNQTYSESSMFQVQPGKTTLIVLSIYVPNEKERIRNKQTPKINIFQLFGKGMEILPNR